MWYLLILVCNISSKWCIFILKVVFLAIRGLLIQRRRINFKAKQKYLKLTRLIRFHPWWLFARWVQDYSIWSLYLNFPSISQRFLVALCAFFPGSGMPGIENTVWKIALFTAKHLLRTECTDGFSHQHPHGGSKKRYNRSSRPAKHRWSAGTVLVQPTAFVDASVRYAALVSLVLS